MRTGRARVGTYLVARVKFKIVEFFFDLNFIPKVTRVVILVVVVVTLVKLWESRKTISW